MSGAVWVVLGPSDHGVVMLAERIVARLCGGARGAGRVGGAEVVVRAADIAALLASAELAAALTSAPAVHVHFTDRLFGSNCASAAEAFDRLAAVVSEEHRSALSVTLHDLPMPADDPGRYRRRAEAYRRVAQAATASVIVSSEHEAALLGEIACTARPLVIPLPIDAGPVRPPDPTTSTVAVLGFVHPGSGHAPVLEALAELPAGIGLTALGRVADGHQATADELAARARELGRTLDVRGWLPPAELPAALRGAGVPILGPRQISASASIGSWLAAGRRPLAPDGPYTRELAERLPGTLAVYPPSSRGVVRALRRALEDPSSTWLPAGVALGPSTAQVAAAYRHAVRRRRDAAVR